MKLKPVNNNVDKLIADRFRELIRHLPTSYTELLTELSAAENSLRSQYSPSNQKQRCSDYRLAIEQAATIAWEHGVTGSNKPKLSQYPTNGNRGMKRITALQRLVIPKAWELGKADWSKARDVGQRKRLDTEPAPAQPANA